MPELLWDPHDQRYVQAVVIGVYLTAGIPRAVIAPKNYNSVFGQAFLFQSIQNQPYLFVDIAQGIVKERHALPEQRRIGHKARYGHMLWIVQLVVCQEKRSLLARSLWR